MPQRASLFTTLFTLVTVCGCDHYKILQDLYFNNHGPGWINSDRWLSQRPLGQWHGVTVDDKQCVTSLVLYQNNLTGTIPLSLGQLDSLQKLDLGSNTLTGTLPSSLAALPNLLVLFLDSNQLNGTIPEEFWNFSKLQKFDANSNLLSGPISSSLSTQLPSTLMGIALGGNMLTGTLSPQFFQRMPELYQITVEFNQLSGTFPDLPSQSKLRTLYAHFNYFNGSLPFLNCTSLTDLHMGRNEFTGPLPEWMHSCKALQLVTLSENFLSGTIPSFLSALPLTELRLGENKFSGTLPQQMFQQLPRLTVFTVDDNHLSGTFPDISSNSKLNKLLVGGNKFTGSFPSLSCTLLRSLTLAQNQFTGTVPEWLSTCNALQDLRLFENSFVGNFPLLNSPELTYLDIGHNHFTGDLLQLISGLPHLIQFYGEDNELTISNGDHGVSITHPTLSTLFAYDNHFTAKIDSISLLTTELQMIDLSGNLLYCPLPLSVTRIRNSDTFVADQCVRDWRSLMMLALPGVLGAVLWFIIQRLLRHKTLLRFLIKVAMNEASLILNMLSLFAFLQLFTPDINMNCNKANSFEVFRRFLSIESVVPKPMTFPELLLFYPISREYNIMRFQWLCARVGASRQTCQYDPLHQECVFNGNSHVQYTQGVREIVIILVVLLLLQQVIATWLVIRALRQDKPISTTQRHLSYPSFLVFLLFCFKSTRAAVDEDMTLGLGRRRLTIDFIQGVVLKGALLLVNVWVVTRIQQTGLSNIQLGSAFLNTVNIFVPLVRVMGRACKICCARKGQMSDELQAPLIPSVN